MSRILVTDGRQRSALAVVRSLGRRGHHVTVAASGPNSLAGASRHAAARVVLPDPLSRPDVFSDRLRREVARLRPEVLLPMTEASLLQTLPLRSELTGVSVPFTDAATFERICDKARVLEEAGEVGIAVPSQHVLDRPAALRDAEFSDAAFPVVAKPSRSVVGNADRRSETGAVHAASRGELARALETLPPAAYPVLVQQRLTGPGVGIFLLRWNGQYLASFAHRRLREKPPSGGVSVYRESIEPDPGLVEQSRDLLDAFDWQGVAMVEYKLHGDTGEPHLMEVNGRFWGSLQLAVEAGVDFPSLLLDAATGADPDPVHRYRTGVRLRWLWGDVDHLLARLTKSRRELALPPGAGGRVRALLDFLRLSPTDRLEVLKLSDPGPFVQETLAWFEDQLPGL